MWLTCYLSENPDSVLLRLRGIVCYRPQYWSWRVRRRKGREKVKKDLYPGYLFVKQFDGWEKIYGVDGIVNILGYAPKGYIEDLQRREMLSDGALIIKQEKPAPVFSIGKVVKIIVGDWTGYFGVVEKCRKGRYKIKVEGMGGDTVVSLPEHYLAMAV